MPNPPNHISFPKENPATSFDLIKTTENKKYQKEDPPLIDLKITNPITYFKKWFTRVLGNEGIIFHFRIRPLTAIFMTVAIVALTTGTSLSIPKILPAYFVSDEVIYTGVLYKRGDGYLLVVNNAQGYTLNPGKGVSLLPFINKEVIVKGSVNKKNSTFEVVEIFPSK